MCKLETTRLSYGRLLTALHALDAKAREEAGLQPLAPVPLSHDAAPAPLFNRPLPPLQRHILSAEGHGLIQNISVDQQAALDARPPDGEGGPRRFCKLHQRDITFS